MKPPRWSSGPGRYPLTVEIRGSNPLRGKQHKAGSRVARAGFSFSGGSFARVYFTFPRHIIARALPNSAHFVKNSPNQKTGGLLIVDRFVGKLVVGATLGAAGWFLGILLIAVVITGIQKLVTNALSGGEMLIFVALQLPRMIVFALPMAMLFGSVQAFAALSRQGEAVALGAAGVSLVRMMRAPLVWAAILTFVSFALSDWLVPPLERSKDSILVSHLSASIGAGGFRYQDPAADEDLPLATLVQAKSFDFKSLTLQQPRVQLFDDDQKLKTQIVAQSARWTGKKWVLSHGVLTTFPPAKDGAISLPTATEFATTSIELPAPEFLNRSANSLSLRLARGDFLMVSLAEVLDYRRALTAQLPLATTKAQRARTEKLIRTATFGIHDKIAAPLICFAFALVGLPLGLHSPRTGGGALGVSFVVLVVYYVVMTWCATLGRPGAVNPVAMAYAPLLLILAIGAWLVWKRNR